MEITTTTIESKSITIQDDELFIRLGLRDKEHKYSTTGVESVMCDASVEAIKGIIEAAGTYAWVRIESCPVRVRRDEDTGRIEAIGHSTEDTWVDLLQVNR